MHIKFIYAKFYPMLLGKNYKKIEITSTVIFILNKIAHTIHTSAKDYGLHKPVF